MILHSIALLLGVGVGVGDGRREIWDRNMLLWVGFGFPPSKSLQITGRGALAGCGCEGIDNDMWKGVFSPEPCGPYPVMPLLT